MKTIYLLIACAVAVQFASGQNRIAEEVSFKSGNETLTGILVKHHSSESNL